MRCAARLWRGPCSAGAAARRRRLARGRSQGRRSRRPRLVRLRPGCGRRIGIQLQQARGRRSIILREPRRVHAEDIHGRRLWRIDAPRPWPRGAQGGGAWIGRIAQRAFHGPLWTLRMCMRRRQRRHAPSQRPSSWIGAVLVHARRCALRVHTVHWRNASPCDRDGGPRLRSGRSGLPSSTNVPGYLCGAPMGWRHLCSDAAQARKGSERDAAKPYKDSMHRLLVRRHRPSARRARERLQRAHIRAHVLDEMRGKRRAAQIPRQRVLEERVRT